MSSPGIPHSFLFVLAIGYAAAVAFFPARRLKGSLRTTVLVLLGVVVLGSAILLETANMFTRFAVAGILVAIFLPHMWDLHLDPGRGSRLSLREYIVFVGDYAWSVARVAGGYGVGLPFKTRLLDAGKYVAGLGVVAIVTVWVFQVHWAAYLFGVTLRHATGCPTTFFLLHGLIVALTFRFKPTGRLALPATIFTFAFNTASTLLLLIPLNQQIPFYVNEIPLWVHL